MDLEAKERMRRFFFSKKKIVVSEKHVRAVHRTRNQIGVALYGEKLSEVAVGEQHSNIPNSNDCKIEARTLPILPHEDRRNGRLTEKRTWAWIAGQREMYWCRRIERQMRLARLRQPQTYPIGIGQTSLMWPGQTISASAGSGSIRGEYTCAWHQPMTTNWSQSVSFWACGDALIGLL